MAGPTITDNEEEDLAAARWVMAIENGLSPEGAEAFHTWLAARPERAELIARQAALPGLARQAQLQTRLDDVAQRVSQDLARRRANEQALQSRRLLLIGGAIAAGAAVLGVAALMTPRRPEESVSEETYETATGEVRALALADASRLWLDTATRLSTRMTRERRDVTLTTGRMFVEVAHNAERPFSVHGPRFEARAIGTAFEATAFEGRTGIAVTNGVVRLTLQNAGSAIDLAKGECAWISASGDITRTTVPIIAAWRERRMVLSDRRLDEALAELSRYFDRPLTVADAQLAARRVTLSFSIAGLGEEDAAHIIADAVDAQLSGRAGEGIVLSPAEHDSDASQPTRSNPR